MSLDWGSIFAKGMLNGIGLALKVLWPLWVLILLLGLGKLLWELREIRRLARSGMKDIDRMDGRTFEKYLEVVFRNKGYKVERTKYIGDYGADIILIGNGERIVVQAKRYKGKVGVKAVQEVVASKGYYNCNRAMVITNSFYTQQAQRLARVNGVQLWNRNDLVRELLAANARETVRDNISVGIHNEIKNRKTDEVVKSMGQEKRDVCAVCGRVVSEKVKAYCLAHADRFEGKIYCYQHQKSQ